MEAPRVSEAEKWEDYFLSIFDESRFHYVTKVVRQTGVSLWPEIVQYWSSMARRILARLFSYWGLRSISCSAYQYGISGHFLVPIGVPSIFKFLVKHLALRFDAHDKLHRWERPNYASHGPCSSISTVCSTLCTSSTDKTRTLLAHSSSWSVNRQTQSVLQITVSHFVISDRSLITGLHFDLMRQF